jgi:hypothetical protein
MRSFKSLWRLALGKRQSRPADSHRQGKPDERTETAAADRPDPVMQLLNADPPTRTLQ